MTEPRSAGSTKARARSKTGQMRAERAARAARQKRNQRILTALGGLVVLGLVVAIAFAVVNASSTDGDSGADGKVVVPASVVDGAIPVGDEGAPVTVDLYYDYMCPACGAFEQRNAQDLSRLLEDGTAKVNLRMMNFLDPQSQGTEYSTRAGNAVATVANDAPEAVWDFHNALYANQPPEGTEGLSDEEIAQIATESGVPADVADTFTDGTYDGWVTQSNEIAAKDGVNSTPTVMINGETFAGDWSQAGQLAAAIEDAAKTP